MHATLEETARGRADDVATFQPPPIATGADGARCRVLEVRTPGGRTVAQLAIVGADGEAVSRLLIAALASVDWVDA